MHLLGRLVTKRTVRSGLDAVKPPGFDEQLGINQARAPMGIETLIPKPALEAFAESVLDRLARVDELQLDSVGVRPLIPHLAGQLWAAVAHNGVRGGAVVHALVKHAHDSRDR